MESKNFKHASDLLPYFDNSFTFDSIELYRKLYPDIVKMKIDYKKNSFLKDVDVKIREYIKLLKNLRNNPGRILEGEYKSSPISFQLKFDSDTKSFILIEKYEPEYEKIQKGLKSKYKIKQVISWSSEEILYGWLMEGRITLQQYKYGIKRLSEV
jgi:hypothetical protein